METSTNTIHVNEINLVKKIREDIAETIASETRRRVLQHRNFKILPVNEAKLSDLFLIILESDDARIKAVIERIEDTLLFYDGRISMVDLGITSTAEQRKMFRILFIDEYAKRVNDRKNIGNKKTNTEKIEEVVISELSVEVVFEQKTDSVPAPVPVVEKSPPVAKVKPVNTHIKRDVRRNSPVNSVRGTKFDEPFIFLFELDKMENQHTKILEVRDNKDISSDFDMTHLVQNMLLDDSIEHLRKYVVKVFPVKERMTVAETYQFFEEHKGLYIGMAGLLLLSSVCDAKTLVKGSLFTFNKVGIFDNHGNERFPAIGSQSENRRPFFAYKINPVLAGDALVVISERKKEYL